jgi:RILP-like protein 1
MLKTAIISNDQLYDYTVADVYDDAAIIGKELEKIIANYGSDILKDLMPKVIHVLELLENLIVKNEKENDELIELKTKVNSLEIEKANRLNEKEKFDKVYFEFPSFIFPLSNCLY